MMPTRSWLPALFRFDTSVAGDSSPAAPEEVEAAGDPSLEESEEVEASDDHSSAKLDDPSPTDSSNPSTNPSSYNATPASSFDGAASTPPTEESVNSPIAPGKSPAYSATLEDALEGQSGSARIRAE